ncbi:MAG: PilC/PilY family type IV pilus protein, partial [Phycisphaerales bacterium]|nr:PilC/PilY family type IV pilus protein [Phycisphaerales bacterium]
DVLHSRPAVINYNRFGTDNDVFVFYGANDGIFHALQGGFASNGGTEVWGFIPQESFSKLKRLRDNTPTISSTTRRDYFFDGPIGIYTLDVNGDGRLRSSDGDKVWLFIGMRRGGRYIYALDVSDPANPKFLWKKGCPNRSGSDGCDTGYERIGQTWSEPKVAYLRAFPTTPVLIFGGGYDASPEDPQPCLITGNDSDRVTARSGGTVVYSSDGTCSFSGTSSRDFDRSLARSIYVVRATDGAVLWRGGHDSGADSQISAMDYSMAADLTILNRDRDNSRTLPGKEGIGAGFIDRIYAVDTGGNLWRADVDSATTSDWTVTKLASISGSTLANKRKFLFAPDVVFSSDSIGRYDAVLVGSGDREHPFDATITNRFYMFKDRSTGLSITASGLPITESDLFDATNNCLQDSTVCNGDQKATASANLLSGKGWFVTLAAGEKAVGTATTISGTTLFNTNQPSASEGGGACG